MHSVYRQSVKKGHRSFDLYWLLHFQPEVSYGVPKRFSWESHRVYVFTASLEDYLQCLEDLGTLLKRHLFGCRRSDDVSFDTCSMSCENVAVPCCRIRLVIRFEDSTEELVDLGKVIINDGRPAKPRPRVRENSQEETQN
eukprot:2830643-Amphidinium_carterae.1